MIKLKNQTLHLYALVFSILFHLYDYLLYTIMKVMAIPLKMLHQYFYLHYHHIDKQMNVQVNQSYLQITLYLHVIILSLE
jgi:hypothetical protein